MTSPPLFDFKAGRILLNPSTGEARPLPGQGRVTIMRSSEDPELLGVQWLPRGSNASDKPTEELLIVPSDVTFSKVPQCKTGRVIELYFASGGEKYLYWLQDTPDGDLYEFSERDEEILKKANELVSTFGGEEDAEMDTAEQ